MKTGLRAIAFDLTSVDASENRKTLLSLGGGRTKEAPCSLRRTGLFV